MTRDPFLGVGRPIGTRTRAGVVEKMTEARPRLVERARKRQVDARGDGAWVVWGDVKLGDAYPDYHVTKEPDARKYDCSCYHTGHGESRQRKMCSHVMAVILWRKDHPEFVGGAPLRSSQPARTAPDVHPDSETDTTPWEPSDPRLEYREPVPEWVGEFRQHQWDAALEVVEAFENGARAVFLDAPTGSGKTLIADLVSRLLGQPAVYMCSTKSLQAQVLADFPYARVLQGRANYPTLKGSDDITADDCDGTRVELNDCSYCDPMYACPYRVAKANAVRAQLAVLNTAYWLREANIPPKGGAFSRPPDPEKKKVGGLFVVDECDTFEDAVLGYVEFSVTRNRLRQLNLTAPKKGSHKTTVAEWITRELAPAALKAAMSQPMGLAGARRTRGYLELHNAAKRIAPEIDSENWVRDNSREDFLPLAYKPVTVAPYGEEMVWRNTGRVLMMSATVISSEQMARDLGLEHEWATVKVPMTFPRENRIVNVAPIVEMTKKQITEQPDTWNKMARSVVKVLDRHPDESVLIHTVSYPLSKHLTSYLCASSTGLSLSRDVITYSKSSERDHALEKFRATTNGVLVAPSFERGVDLKDDDCRVVIVAKVPFPYMGDPQINARLHTPDGQGWFNVQTVRALVQMTGRHVRHADDYGVSYILDASFTKNIMRRAKHLLPDWWLEALCTSFKVKDLL